MDVRKIPNGTWVAILLVGGIGLSILYAVLGGDEPLFTRDRQTPTAAPTSAATPAPTPGR